MVEEIEAEAEAAVFSLSVESIVEPPPQINYESMRPVAPMTSDLIDDLEAQETLLEHLRRRCAETDSER